MYINVQCILECVYSIQHTESDAHGNFRANKLSLRNPQGWQLPPVLAQTKCHHLDIASVCGPERCEAMPVFEIHVCAVLQENFCGANLSSTTS